MAWPASVISLEKAFNETNTLALGLKNQAQQLSDDSLTGNVVRRRVLTLRTKINFAIERWNSAKSLTGIAAYARDQFQNQTIDVAAEFNAMQTAAENLRNWIDANFPVDATTGAALVVEPDGTHLVFTSAQLSGLRTQIAAFVATIS